MTVGPAPVLNSARAYWTETQVAERLAISVKWLRSMRQAGGGIPFAKFASSVRYRIDDVLAFEAASMRSSTSDPVDPRPSLK